MAPPRKRKPSAGDLGVESVRTFLQMQLKERLPSREEKEKFADYSGLALPSIDSMIYRGEGGLDSWVKAFMYCFGLSPGQLEEGLVNLKASVAKGSGPRKAADLWKRIEYTLTEDKKYFWASLISAAEELPITLKRKERSAPLLRAAEPDED